MASPTTKPDAVQPEAEAGVALFDGWFDPIEAALRDRARAFIETMISSELDAALARVRYARRPAAGEGGDGAAAGVVGHRHGRRTRTLTGTFGTTEVTVPRARLVAGDGRTSEWKSKALRSYQRRTKAADALIAGAYLAGTNTRRVRRALAARFGEAVGQDVVSRTWRKVRSDWDAWNGRDLAAEPMARLILDGTVARVRLDRKATSVSLLVALGVRRDGQKVLLAVKTMGGESEAAWRALLDDLVTRGLRPPGLIIVDGAPGLEKALAALWPAVPAQRCTVRKHRNLLAHAPDKLHGEISADYQDMIYATTEGGRAAPQSFPAQVAAQMPSGRRQPGGGRRAALHLHPIAGQPMEISPDDQCRGTAARGVQATDQDADGAAISRDRGHALLGAARLGSDHDAQGRWLADDRPKRNRSDD